MVDFASKVNICQQTKAASAPLSKSFTIIYVSQNKKDPENHYHEILMLFLPWRDEEIDLKGNCDSYKDRYMMHNDDIEKIRVHYEKFNEDLEEAFENAASKEYEENISANDEDIENNTFGFFDPDHDENLKQYLI